MSDLNNRHIIDAIKSGNEKAFELYLRAEFNNVMFFAGQFLRDSMLAKDVAQETFIALWNSRENLDPSYNLRSYIFTIAKNKSLNMLRAKHYSAADPLEKREIQVYINALTSDVVSTRIDSLDLEKLIEKTYKNLPDKIKDSFILSRKLGLTYEDIAKRKGISVKAVEYHISLALKLFRKRLKDYLGIIIVLLFFNFLEAVFSGIAIINVY